MKNLTVFTPLPMTSTNEIHNMRNTQHTIETEVDLETEETVQRETLEQQLWDENLYEDVSDEELDEEQQRQRVQSFVRRMGF